MTSDALGAVVRSPISGQEERSSWCGRVVSVSCRGPSSAVTLQLARSWGRPDWQVVIPPEYRGLFGTRVEDRYDEQLICIAPGIAAAAGNGSVVVRDPGQLVVQNTEPTSTALPDDVFRTCDPDVELPVLVRHVPARYTAEAMRLKVRGIVDLRAIVSREGAVRDVRVVRSLEPSLDIAARDAFAEWEFRPATRHGAPVEMAVSAQMAFAMR